MAVLHGRPDMVWPFEGKGSEEDGVCYLVHSVSFTEEVLAGKVAGANDMIDLVAHAAVEKGDLAALEHALSQRLNSRSVDLLNEDGQSLLTAAAGLGHLEIVQRLVHKKADVNHKAKDGSVPIVTAALSGVGDVVHALLRTNRVEPLARFGEEGSTALHLAAQSSKIEVSNDSCPLLHDFSFPIMSIAAICFIRIYRTIHCGTYFYLIMWTSSRRWQPSARGCIPTVIS